MLGCRAVAIYFWVLEQSLCHRMKAEAMKLSALGDEESHIYECNPDGTFRLTIRNHIVLFLTFNINLLQ